MRNAQDVIDISRPLNSLEALDNIAAVNGTATVVYGGDQVDYPQSEPEKFSDDWLRTYRSIKSLKMAPYIGSAMLLDFCEHKEEHISTSHLLEKLKPLFDGMKAGGIEVPSIPGRVLIKTGSTGAALSFDALQWLDARGAILIGIDKPDVNRPENTNNADYMRMHNIVWLVNLNLQQCEEGPYFLAALPLTDVEEGTVAARAFLALMPGG